MTEPTVTPMELLVKPKPKRAKPKSKVAGRPPGAKNVNGVGEIKHGTPAGARQHNRRNEPTCEDFRLARNKYQQGRKMEARIGNPKFDELGNYIVKLKPCGTSAAYQRHITANEKPDAACLAARVEENRRQKTIKRIGKRLNITPKKAAQMPQATLDQMLTGYVEQGLEDSVSYKVMWAEHESRSKEQQEAMTAREFGGDNG